jgi:hypothetical protein
VEPGRPEILERLFQLVQLEFRDVWRSVGEHGGRRGVGEEREPLFYYAVTP